MVLQSPVSRTSHDSRVGSGQCLSGLAGWYHDRGNISGGRDCNGSSSSLEGIDPRRKHLADGGLDWRIRRRRSNFHAACIRALQGVAIVPAGRRLLEIHRADHGGQHSRSSIHLAGAAGHGGRSRTAVSGIAGRIGNPQGGPARSAGREISLLEYRPGRDRLYPRKVWAVRGR